MSDASGGDRPGEATDRCERTSLAGRRCVLRTGHREFGQLDCDFFGEDRPSEAIPHHRAIAGHATTCASADEQIVVLGREVERLDKALRGIRSTAAAHDDHGIVYLCDEVLGATQRSAEDPTAYYCAACKDTGCSECNGHTYAQRGQCPAVDQGSRCVYGRGHRINRHCDGERSWPKEQGSEPTTRGWTSLSDERIDVLATRAGGHCVGAPATRDEERAMALEIRKARAQRRERATPDEKPSPIPMFLTCPRCNTRHIDEGDFATKSHHTHSCQECGLTWRPAVVATVGVQFLPGFKNERQQTSGAKQPLAHAVSGSNRGTVGPHDSSRAEAPKSPGASSCPRGGEVVDYVIGLCSCGERHGAA